jgi:hypothetical protein
MERKVMVQDVVFDLGGVVFRWQPMVLLQELFPTQVTNETVASEWASAVHSNTLRCHTAVMPLR